MHSRHSTTPVREKHVSAKEMKLLPLDQSEIKRLAFYLENIRYGSVSVFKKMHVDPAKESVVHHEETIYIFLLFY